MYCYFPTHHLTLHEIYLLANKSRHTHVFVPVPIILFDFQLHFSQSSLPHTYGRTFIFCCFTVFLEDVRANNWARKWHNFYLILPSSSTVLWRLQLSWNEIKIYCRWESSLLWLLCVFMFIKIQLFIHTFCDVCSLIKLLLFIIIFYLRFLFRVCVFN